MKEYERMGVKKLEINGKDDDDDVIEEEEEIIMRKQQRKEKLGSLLDEHRIEFDEIEGDENDIFSLKKLQANNNNNNNRSDFASDLLISSIENLASSSSCLDISRHIQKRVTIHNILQPPDGSNKGKSQYGKLMLLPNSIQDLCKIAGTYLRYI